MITEKYKNRRKNSKGFTLLEIVLSIAALSFTGVFILQMFLLSFNINRHAKAVDMAVAETVTAIEIFKSKADPADFLDTVPMAHVSEVDGMLVLRVYYDKDWHTMATPEGAYFCLETDIIPEMPADENGDGRLYVIKAGVSDISNPVKPRLLVSLLSKKYFPG